MYLTDFLLFPVPNVAHLGLDSSSTFEGHLPAAALSYPERLAQAKRRRQRGNVKAKVGWREGNFYCAMVLLARAERKEARQVCQLSD